MTEQFDMFARAPAEPVSPVASAHDEFVYAIVPKGDRFAINWRCGDRIGVLGGLYRDEEDALGGIEFHKRLRAQRAADPGPWLRTERLRVPA